MDAQSKHSGGTNGRVIDQLTPLFEHYSEHSAYNELPFLKIPVSIENRRISQFDGVETDVDLGTYLLYVDNAEGENLYLVHVALGEGKSFDNGLVTVHDLAGEYVVGYRFEDGEYQLVSEELETNPNGKTNGVECWYVDHYTCTVRVGPDDCELDYTTVHCEYYADRPPLIFGDGSGEGGGSGEGSSLTGPVQCDDGYFADEQGRCINACGPGMVYDGNGGCNEEGDRPEKEYADKCTGIVDMFNSYPNNEASGYLTADGQVILTNITGQNGGAVFGTYFHNGTYYYPFPMTDGAPSNTYAGMVTSRGYYFIPVVASIHTHTPCLNDGTSGVSEWYVSQADKDRAAAAPGISHWVIGCNAIGQFNANNDSYFNVSNGSLSSICNHLN